MNGLEIEAALKHAWELGEKGRWTEAIAAYRELADIRNEHAMAMLGWAYETGSGVTASLTDAENWYRKAARMKNLWARYQASRFLARHGRHSESFAIVDELAHQGYLPAIYRLSRLFASGQGTGKDLELSSYYLDYAASYDHVWAMRERAVTMMKGGRGLRKVIPGFCAFLSVLIRAFRIAAAGNPSDSRLLR